MEQKSKRADGGFSLIEVVVGLLILSVIVVPLLRTFIIAQNTNAQARLMQYANTVAENLMEEIKAGNYPVPAVTPEADGSYIRLLSGDSILQEGTAVFTAEVIYNPTGYHQEGVGAASPTDVNDYLPPEIIPVDGIGTVSILLDLETADRLALDTFIDRNRAAVDTYNAMLDLETTPTPIPMQYDANIQALGKYTAIGDGYVTMSDHLRRKITVTIEELDNGRLQVGCTATYELKSSSVYLGGYPTSESIQIFASEPFAKDVLKHLYIFYRPLYGVSVLGTEDAVTLDLRLKGLPDGAFTSEDSLLNVFLVVREGILHGVEPMSCELTIPEAARGALEKLRVYSQYNDLRLTVNGSAPYFSEQQINQSGVLIPQAEAKDRLYDVSVRVFHDGKQMTSLNGSVSD